MFGRFVFMVGGCLALSSCGTVENGAREIPPAELIQANIEETDITVKGRCVEVTVTDEDSSYAVHAVQLEVEEVLKGQASVGDRIHYHLRVEKGLMHPVEGEHYLVSLNRRGDQLVIPDVGYHFRSPEQ